MSYNALAQQLELMPIMIEMMFKEGIERQYSHVRRAPAGQPLRGKRAKNKARDIIVPGQRLKAIQRRIAETLTPRFAPHRIAHGYTKGCSVTSNARTHIGSKLLLKVDLVNFFGSVRQPAVTQALRQALRGCSDQDIERIAALCCFHEFLPHGSPASPILSNMVCYSLDADLNKLANSSDCRVSRFSDDICFSTRAASFPSKLVEYWSHGGPQEIELGAELPAVIAAHGFEINWSKLQVHSRGGRMQVTGVSVGETDISVPRDFRDNIRACIHQWDKHGLRACANKRQRTGCTRAFVNRLKGCIAHVGNVEGTDCARFQRLSLSVENLLDRDRAQLCPIVDRDNHVCRHSRRLTI